MTAVAVASLAISAYGAQQQNEAGKRQAKAAERGALATATSEKINAELLRIDAERIQKASTIEADMIREAAIQMRGEQAAAQAVSGTLVGSGSNLVMTEDTTKRAEADALATVIDGIYGTQNKNASARYSDMAAKETILSGGLSAGAALMAGRTNAMTTIGSGAIHAYSTYSAGYKPNQVTTKKDES